MPRAHESERLVENVWNPMLRELDQVLREGGAVAEAASHWTTIDTLTRESTPASFQGRMRAYLQQRRVVAQMRQNAPGPSSGPPELQAEQAKLAELSEGLIADVRRAIQSQPQPKPSPTDAAEKATWKKYGGG